MITEALLGIVKLIVGGINLLLPNWTMQLPEGTNTFIAQMRAYNEWVPISEVLTVTSSMVLLVVGYVGFKWIIKIWDWVMDVIP